MKIDYNLRKKTIHKVFNVFHYTTSIILTRIEEMLRE